MASFQDRIAELQSQVGVGDLTASIEFDQPYAAVQEEGGWLDFLGKDGPKAIVNHPGGGGSKYLGSALLNYANRAAQNLADHVLDDEEGSLIRAQAANAEKIAADASANAPIEFGDLKESDHPQVLDNGVVVYDRPPAVPRLSDAELKAKGSQRGRSLRRNYLPAPLTRYATIHPGNGGTRQVNPRPHVDRRSSGDHADVDLSREIQERGLRFHWTDKIRNAPQSTGFETPGQFSNYEEKLGRTETPDARDARLARVEAYQARRQREREQALERRRERGEDI